MVERTLDLHRLQEAMAESGSRWLQEVEMPDAALSVPYIHSTVLSEETVDHSSFRDSVRLDAIRSTSGTNGPEMAVADFSDSKSSDR